MTTLRVTCGTLVLAGLFALVGSADESGKLKFEVYKDKAGEFRWRLKAANGRYWPPPGRGTRPPPMPNTGSSWFRRPAPTTS